MPKAGTKLTDSSKVFDRVTVMVSAIGILLMTAVLILVVRGPSTAGAAVDGTIAEIELFEFAITGDLSVPEGASRSVSPISAPSAHNLTLVGGPSTPDLNAGESATLNLGDMVAGQYQLICAIPGHESSGMTAMLAVGDVAATDPHAGNTATDYAAMDVAMTESILAFPASTEGVGNQPLEPVILVDRTKQYDVTIGITPWEVEAGRFVDAWTYNGSGPRAGHQGR